jgi:two-component system invasion response regulator UvrY
MLKIMIADDHAVVRRGLRQLLADGLQDPTFGEVSDGDQLVAALAAEPWDLVLLDLSMPRRSGLDVLSELREQHPKLPILVISMHPEEQFAVRALRSGASGYVTKEAAPDELLDAAKKVLAGGRYVSRGLAERMVSELDRPGARLPHERLSEREHQVLMKIASGRTVGEIADELTLSVKTVSTYRARLLDKMSLENNADLMRYALVHKLIT